MRFEATWYWLILPPLLGYLWWLTRRSYANVGPRARQVSFGLRAIILTLLLAALSRPELLYGTAGKHVIFALDVSQSIGADNLGAALDDIDRLAAEATDQGHLISVVAFGEQARLVVRPRDEWDGWTPELREQLTYVTSLPALSAERAALLAAGEGSDAEQLQSLQDRIERAETFRDAVAGNHTDLERAMRLALNCGPTDVRRTIYVLTDGNFNHGRWTRAWAAAAEVGVPVHLVTLDRPIPPEVAAADLQLPPMVRVNQGFSAELRVASTVETTAHLRVFKDGFAVHDRDVPVVRGENRYEIPGLYFLEKGFHTVEVAVRAADDTELKNNTTRALIVVPGEARVLYIDGDEDQIPYLKSALELEGMHVEARPATGVPQSLSELLSFDAFVLSNVPADRLTARQMQMIRSYVRDFGGGFLMLGGDESFGLGGYFKTPIEEILPVSMPIQKDLLRPSLALVLVIDKSGSMVGVKIQLAKRAAISTAEVINAQDRIGVIGFDAESRIILDLTPAADRGTINSHISALNAGGGTFLYPALEDAHAMLMESGARRKHVIVLSDGQTQGFGYEELVGMMAADGITLSAVGIGDGADMQLMESMALAGDGRAYFTNDFFSIPQIFTREALRASKNMLVEGLVVPSVLTDDVALLEIDADELPLLTGYVATTPKPGADVIIVSDSGDPILAKWRHGLGRSAAFTSEPKPRWAEDWIQWPDFAKFWSQLVRSVTGQNLGETVSVECEHFLDGTGITLTADIRDSSGNFVTDMDLQLSAAGPGGPNRKLPVEHVGPGLFEASIPEIAYGRDEQFVWQLCSANPGTRTIPYGFVYSFSPEFRTLGIGDDTVDQITARETGDVMSVGQSRLSIGGARSVATIELWVYLLLVAILLVPLDILCRRLG